MAVCMIRIKVIFTIFLIAMIYYSFEIEYHNKLKIYSEWVRSDMSAKHYTIAKCHVCAAPCLDFNIIGTYLNLFEILYYEYDFQWKDRYFIL